MDPISFVLTIAILYALVKRAPGYLGDLVDAIRNGLDTSAYRDQLRRLRKAGISPSQAGALWRRYLGNAWREATNDLNNRRRAATAGLGRQASRWRQRLDDAAGQAADNIRARRDRQAESGQDAAGPVRATATVHRPVAAPPPALPTGGRGGTSGGGSPPPPPAPSSARPAPGPVWATAAIPAAATRNPTTVTATVGRSAAAPAAALSAAPSAAALPGGGGTATAVLDGEVITPTQAALPAASAPRAIEGAGSSMAVEVTGVVSGAMEARGIAAAVEMANQAYMAELSRARSRIARLIDATLTNVQMQGGGDVMTPLLAASEAAAVAQAAARNCGAEVGPLMAQVAAEFDRRNS